MHHLCQVRSPAHFHHSAKQSSISRLYPPANPQSIQILLYRYHRDWLPVLNGHATASESQRQYWRSPLRSRLTLVLSFLVCDEVFPERPEDVEHIPNSCVLRPAQPGDGAQFRRVYRHATFLQNCATDMNMFDLAKDQGRRGFFGTLRVYVLPHV